MIRVAFACLVVGILLMVVVEEIWLGVPLLFAFIVLGVFAIADPAFLSDEDLTPGGEAHAEAD
jgi:hypothetical protein